MAIELGNNIKLVEDEKNGWTILSSVDGGEIKLAESVIHENTQMKNELEEGHENNENIESEEFIDFAMQEMNTEDVRLKDVHVLDSSDDKATDMIGQGVENFDNGDAEIHGGDADEDEDVDVDANAKSHNLIKDGRFEDHGYLKDCVDESRKGLEDHTESIGKTCVDDDDLRYIGWDVDDDDYDEEENNNSDANYGEDRYGWKDDISNDDFKDYDDDSIVLQCRKRDVPWMRRQTVEPNHKHGVKQGFVEENPCPKQGLIWRVSLVVTVGLFGWAVMTGLTGGGKNVRCTKLNPCNMKGEPVLNSI